MGCVMRVGAEPGVVVGGRVGERLVGYRAYLLLERGVSEATVAGYEPDARLLLCVWLGSGRLWSEQLTGADVSGVLVSECAGRCVSAALRLVTVRAGGRRAARWGTASGR
jgi:hypothetical protein